VVGSDSATTAALVRIDVTVDSATGVDTAGLTATETITASIVGVPTGVVAKTLAVNGGSMADTSTFTGTALSRGDLSIIEVKQTSGSASGVAGATRTTWTDWSKIAYMGNYANADTLTVAPTTTYTDAQIGNANTEHYNMDGTRQSNSNNNTASYYVSIFPRPGASVVDMGAYTVQFQLTDAGTVISTQTVKIDFVSSAAKSDATLAIAQTGTFLRLAALATTDTAGSTNANLTLRNRDGGHVRLADGTAPVPVVRIQQSTAANPVYAETGTLFASDTGTAGLDKGVAGAGGSGTLRPYDGVYGLYTSVLPSLKTVTTAGSEQLYRFYAAYGNATIATSALTLFDPSGAGSASAFNTDVLVTAAGMSAANQLEIVNDADGAYTWTLPTSTTSATVRFNIETSADTATPGAEMTVTPTWSGSHGSANVTPATSTTGTTYTTDASGNFTVTVTNTAPVAGASVALKVTGGAAFGTGSYTATLTWAAPAAATIAVADPLSGVYVKTGSTNVTTVIVKDQFGSPVANQSVSVALSSTSATTQQPQQSHLLLPVLTELQLIHWSEELQQRLLIL